MIDLSLPVVVDLSVRLALLAVAIEGVLTVFRVRSSSTRHTAWTAVLAVMLLMPVLPRIVPSIDVPILLPLSLTVPDASPYAVARSTNPAQAVSSAPAVASPTRADDRAAVTSTHDAALDGASRSFSWRTVALAAYVIGVACFMLRLLTGLVQLARIRRQSRPIAELAGMCESSVLASPVTIGFFSPRVVLPVGWREWPPDMLTAVVAHERMHARRRDPLVSFLARLNCAMYWFHPAAWWIERELAITAEHACDDAAVKEVTRRRYAETLLEIAAIVRRNRGRLAWHAVGVDGNGRLERRIDRVLAESPSPAPSRMRHALFAASCVAVIVAAIACRQDARLEPLREDPKVAVDIKAQRARQELHMAAEEMTRDQAAALERALEQNPEDMAAREKLLVFYGRNRRAQDWRMNAVARRPHALWLIQHHPDSELVMSARVRKSEDPDGYAQARRLWLAAIERRDVDAKVLGNAASFFQGSEKALAEEILQRAQKQGPDRGQPNWSWRLGVLYASSIMGKPADDPDARWARQRLAQSSDARVLYTAGYDLSWRPVQAEMRQFGKQLLERASQLDPGIAERVRTLVYERETLSLDAFDGKPPESWPAILEKLNGVERLRSLTTLSERQYMMAEYFDWLSRQPEDVRRSAVMRGPVTPESDKQTASQMFARSKSYAREALDLGESLGAAQHPDLLFRAHIAYGLHALREGDREEAVEHLLEASRLPVSAAFNERQIHIEDQPFALEYRLVNYLLKNGERTRVIEYLERGAQRRNDPRRGEMLKAAAAIRDGRMPEQYQRLVAAGSL